MDNRGRRIRVGVWTVGFSVILLLAVLPQSYIPERLAPVVTAKGRFAGQPVQVEAPKGGKPDVAVVIRVEMGQGVCRVSLKEGAAPIPLFSMGKGKYRNRIPAGSELVLDPEGNAGEYGITLGPEWHPLAPKTRRFVLLPMAIALVATPLFARRLRPHAERLGTRRVFFLVGTAVISGLVFYPVVHEAGHMIFGMLFGGTPNWDGVVWTPLGGEEPHASVTHLPEGAAPFITAGGALLPVFAAVLLLLIWNFINKNASWYVSAALVTVAALFLFSTLGCLFELYGNTHMDALSVHFGLTGPLRVAFSLSPLMVAIAAYVWLGIKIRNVGRDFR